VSAILVTSAIQLTKFRAF